MSRFLRAGLVSRLVFAVIAVAMANLTLSPVSAADERIMRSEVESYIRWLELDLDQRTIVWQLFADYEKDFETHYLPLLKDFYDDRDAVYRLADPPGAPSRSEWNRLENEARALREEREQLEERFFAQVEVILHDDDQRERMSRVRLGRDRVVFRATSADLPEGNVDLFDLIDTFIRKVDPPLAPDTLFKIEEIIHESEAAFVDALRANAIAQLQSRPIAHEGIRVGRMSEQTDDAAERQAFLDRYAEIAREFGRIRYDRAWHLVEFNRRLLIRFEAVLPREAAAAFRQKFLERAYPQVYPDPAMALSLIEEALAMKKLEPLPREQIVALRNRYIGEHERISRGMAQVILERRIAMMRNAEGDNEVASEKWTQLLAFGAQRELLHTMHVRQIRSIIGPELAQELSEWKYDDEPMPRLWDPRGNRVNAVDQRRRDMERRLEDMERRRRGGGGK